MNKTIWLLFLLLANTFAEAQLKITPIKKRYDSSGFGHTFPLIEGPNKEVADNINNYLQGGLLGNDSILTDADKIFENSVTFDSSNGRLSGLTSIEYEIVVNNQYVLSLKFEIQTMGAYPESYPAYFSFNVESGEPVAITHLVTPDGITWLKKYLVAERAVRIKEHLTSEEISVEDSADVRERLIECNTEADEDRLFIKPATIQFYKDMCFPHIMRVYELNNNVDLAFTKLKKYFTPLGKKILRKQKQ